VQVHSVTQLTCCLLLAWTAGLLPTRLQAADAAQAEHFEKVIRPLLMARCVECHGEETQWGELRLDRKAGFQAGGENGPVVLAGDPDQSRLIAAVRREGDLAMPPENPLPADEVALLEAWVRDGATWPDDGTPLADPSNAARTHWAFQPVAEVEPPAIDDIPWAGSWVRSPVDAFIARSLADAGLEPAAEADRRTLIRRLTYDLTGLPPTTEDVTAFESDPNANASERLVERLVASPHYGEAQARRWLDLARYADTKGYVYAREHREWVHAATYRDWVVKAFNSDLPYDRFLTLQLAADQAAPDDLEAQAAMGFLTLGRRFLGVTHDIIDDRIDTVTRTTMGLTVACARCHDHKYDPIPTDDYYALYGVFASCTEELLRVGEPGSRDTSPPSDEANAAFEAGLAERQQKFDETMATRRSEAATRARSRFGDYLIAQTELENYPAEGFDTILGDDDLIPAFVRQFERFFHREDLAHDPVFAPWVSLSHQKADDSNAFMAAVPPMLASLAERGIPLNGLVAGILEPPPGSMRDLATRYGQLFADVESQWQAAVAAAVEAGTPPPEQLENTEAEQLRHFLYGPQAPCTVPDEPIVSTEGYFTTSGCEELWKLQGEIDRWLLDQPAAAAYTLRLVDREPLRTPWVFRRGNPKQPIHQVPRRFLSVTEGEHPSTYDTSSGRLEMAHAITDPANPLTARVWVNRLWQQHFGRGLVDTPSDFGTRASTPSHPALLDWLASELVESGWSTKHIHRLIVGSATYRQRSDAACSDAVAARAREIDPGNRLLWRMIPRRLSFEAYRDTLLALADRLDPTLGGPAADMLAGDGLANRRRSLYGQIDRQFFPTVLRVFDMANPDLHVPRRSETTVPQQALFALNHPFVAEHAKAIVAATATASVDPATVVERLYATILQREPTPAQRASSVAFIEQPNDPTAEPRPETKAWQYGYGPVDPESGTLTSFTPLPHFTGDAWQGGDAWPDAALGWVQLTADGGHTGNDLAHSSIRRWTAPHDGTFQVVSEVIHEVEAGDGIRCHLLVDGRRVAEAVVHNSRAALSTEPLALTAGSTIDFVADVREILNSDQHLWTATINEVPPTTDSARPPLTDAHSTRWSSQADFSGPEPVRLTRLEQLAQVLLISNETLFVD
jgi:hypothetical protein